jgi:transcriptional regulator GlxA family with amidase domain
LKALTNLSPTDFIRYIRLKRAKDLLEKNAGTVSEVAYQVGFSNHSYFAKCFKEQFGFLPSEVRRP